MQAYLSVLEQALGGVPSYVGRDVPDCRAAFAVTFRHNMALGFPLLTTKKIRFDYVLAELVWMLSGEEKITELKKHCPIWTPWADENDDVPSPYGYFWRRGPDQLAQMFEGVFSNPLSRRWLVSAWHAENAYSSKLPPCHHSFVVNCKPGADESIIRVNMHVNMRSTDVPVGLPYNIASYAALTEVICHVSNVRGFPASDRKTFLPGTLAITMTDCHVYGDQIELAKEQITREPGRLPMLRITGGECLKDFTTYDAINLFQLTGYHPQLHIPYPVAV